MNPKDTPPAAGPRDQGQSSENVVIIKQDDPPDASACCMNDEPIGPDAVTMN